MDIYEANQMAWDLLHLHKLVEKGWIFNFDKAVRRVGVCNKAKQIISVSYKYVQINSREEIEETVKHEIAHALCKGKGHGKDWKIMAQSIGAKPERLATTVISPKSKYASICVECKRTYHRNRLPRKGYSILCCEIKLMWKRNHE